MEQTPIVMKNKFLVLAASLSLLAPSLTMVSCTAGPNAQAGTATGAIGGGLLGGIIGHQSGHTAGGAAIGAVSGGFLGNVVGGSYDRGYGYYDE